MSCLFCGIVAGDIPSRTVYSDDQAIAFLDVSPWHRGHTLVIPRRHLDDITEDVGALAEIAPAVSNVSRLLMQNLGADGLNVLTNAGPASGQEVFHLHVHVVPRYADSAGIGRMVPSAEDRVQPTDADLDAVLSEIARGAKRR